MTNMYQFRHMAGQKSVPRVITMRSAQPRPSLEPLERRALFSVDPGNDFVHALNVGDLNGQQTFNDSVATGDFTDFYQFTMPRAGMFFGRLRVNNFAAQIDLFQQTIDSHGNPQETRLDFKSATRDGPDNGFASGDLPGRFLNAGTYFIEVSARGADTSYLMRMTADYAGNTLAAARNVGSLTDASFQDFVGLDTSPSLHDPVDIYKIKMDARGQLTADFSLDNTDFSVFKAHIDVSRDINGNGVIDSGEIATATGPTTSGKVVINLAAGTYFVRVTSDLNFSNYHLHMNADYGLAGEARPMGSLDKIKSFNDFISAASDPIDDYQFSVGSTRPLFLAYSSTADDGLTAMTLFKDTNSNGVADPSERVVATIEPHFATLLTTVDAGNYIVRVQAEGGAGTYTLAAETRPDGAGNALKTAKNLGTINGLKHVDDYVSTADPVDFYKFTASASGTVGASLVTEFGGDADLALIRDANNNGIVDKNELLATATLSKTTGAQELIKPITAGNYFLRVTYKQSQVETSKYFVSFQTDYAGATPKSARNVGSLFGTRTFDDWASGPFTGAISDTSDVYKFSLSSTKTFSANLVGVIGGQDLDLQLYRDKNNDGVLSTNELVASSHKLNSPNEQISKSLSAGTYFLKVVGVNGETNYHLTLKA